MPSFAARFYGFFLRNFQKPKPNSTLEQMVAWFRDMNVHNPRPVHVHFCRLEERVHQELRYHYILPKNISSNKVLLYLHGGSYAGGPHLLQWSLIARIAKQAGCKAVMLHYRLAPEHPFPAALEDTLNIYAKLQQENPGAEIVFVGDSAGAGLALGASLRLKEAGLTLPAKLVLVSPLLDVSLQNPAITPIEPLDPMLVRPGVQKISRAYAATTAQDHPHVSPLYGKLEGLPPMLLAIGTHDIFYPDTLLFRQKAAEAGVPLVYVEEEGLFHDWPMFPLMPESAKTIHQIVGFMTGLSA